MHLIVSWSSHVFFTTSSLWNTIIQYKYTQEGAENTVEIIAVDASEHPNKNETDSGIFKI